MMVIGLGLAVAACGGSQKPAGGGGGGGGGNGGTGMMVSVTSGDASCVVVLNVGGKEQTMPGDYNLCPGGERDASKLAGKQVSYTTQPGNVAAASCQGDPDCKATDHVNIVQTITAQ
jgi:hypothetical protein